MKALSKALSAAVVAGGAIVSAQAFGTQCPCALSNVDYYGHDVDKLFEGPGTECVEACQKACQKNTYCHFFTYITDRRECYLKDADASRDPRYHATAISGPKYCGAAPNVPGKPPQYPPHPQPPVYVPHPPVPGKPMPPAVIPIPPTKPDFDIITLCYKDNIDYFGFDLKKFDSGVAATPYACQQLCAQEEGCRYWTFTRHDKVCYLKTRGATAGARTNTNAISGPRHCDMVPQTCFENDVDYYGCDIQAVEGHVVVSPVECQKACQTNPACKYWTWVSSQRNCYLKSEGAIKNRKPSPGSVSGPRVCDGRFPPSQPPKYPPHGHPPHCLEYNVEYVHGTFRTCEAPNLKACQALCRADSRCEYVTFKLDLLECALKTKCATKAKAYRKFTYSTSKHCNLDQCSGKHCRPPVFPPYVDGKPVPVPPPVFPPYVDGRPVPVPPQYPPYFPLEPPYIDGKPVPEPPRPYPPFLDGKPVPEPPQPYPPFLDGKPVPEPPRPCPPFVDGKPVPHPPRPFPPFLDGKPVPEPPRPYPPFLDGKPVPEPPRPYPPFLDGTPVPEQPLPFPPYIDGKPVPAPVPPKGCIELNTDYTGNTIGSTTCHSVATCQRVCQLTAGCHYFSYVDHLKQCNLKGDKGVARPCPGIFSGPAFCTPSGPSPPDVCYHYAVIVGDSIGSDVAYSAPICQNLCMNKPGCTYFTYSLNDGECIYFKNKHYHVPSPFSISGLRACSGGPVDHDWGFPNIPPPSLPSYPAKPHPSHPPSTGCVHIDVDFTGHNVGVVRATCFAECQRACEADDECHCFTFDERTGQCYLKSETGLVTPNKGCVSGLKYCH